MKPFRKSRHGLTLGQTRSRTFLPVTRSPMVIEGHSSNGLSSRSRMDIQIYRDVFKLIDRDADGQISQEDLKATYKTLGMKTSDKEVEEMLSHTNGSLNYTEFACMMGSRMSDMDDTDILLNAFKILDEESRGKIHFSSFCKKLRSVGYERMKLEEITEFARIAPVDENGMLDYRKFVNLLKGNSNR